MLPALSSVMHAATVPGIPTLAALTSYSDTQYNSQQAAAQVTLNAAGDIIIATGELGSFDSGDWLSPKQGMPEYRVRWTNDSGTINIGTAGSWSASMTVGVSVTGGAKECTGTAEIARADDLTTILATKQITLSAVSNAGEEP